MLLHKFFCFFRVQSNGSQALREADRKSHLSVLRLLSWVVVLVGVARGSHGVASSATGACTGGWSGAWKLVVVWSNVWTVSTSGCCEQCQRKGMSGMAILRGLVREVREMRAPLLPAWRGPETKRRSYGEHSRWPLSTQTWRKSSSTSRETEIRKASPGCRIYCWS